jgi:alkaline phosphatase D
MFGAAQMEWLKNALRQSKDNRNINFRLIANGSQMLNPIARVDGFVNYSVEYKELLAFLATEKINGVVFLSGDMHHTEIIKLDRKGTYPLYDITCSPLTAGTHKFPSADARHPYRVLGIDEKQNYGRISFTGKGLERKLHVQFKGVQGEILQEWSVQLQDLQQ